MVIDDVYCFASIINHSAGLDIIKALSGKDVTKMFYEIHPKIKSTQRNLKSIILDRKN